MTEDTMTPTTPTLELAATAREAIAQMVRRAQAELEAAREAERVAAEAQQTARAALEAVQATWAALGVQSVVQSVGTQVVTWFELKTPAV